MSPSPRTSPSRSPSAHSRSSPVLHRNPWTRWVGPGPKAAWLNASASADQLGRTPPSGAGSLGASGSHEAWAQGSQPEAVSPHAAGGEGFSSGSWHQAGPPLAGGCGQTVTEAPGAPGASYVEAPGLLHVTLTVGEEESGDGSVLLRILPGSGVLGRSSTADMMDAADEAEQQASLQSVPSLPSEGAPAEDWAAQEASPVSARSPYGDAAPIETWDPQEAWSGSMPGTYSAGIAAETWTAQEALPASPASLVAGPESPAGQTSPVRGSLAQTWDPLEARAAAAAATGPWRAHASALEPQQAAPARAPAGLLELAEEEERQRRAAAEELDEAHWALLRLAFERIAPDGCRQVATQWFLSELQAVGSPTAVLMDRIVPVQGRGGARRTTLRQALEYVYAQHLPTVNWDGFQALLLEAPFQRRLSLEEAMAGFEGFRGSPNLQPELANRWLEEALGVDLGILSRIHNRFVHCQRASNAAAPVPRGTLARSVKSCESLMVALRGTPLGPSRGAVPRGRRRTWGDVVVDLECHEFDALTWADVLEVVRWSREIDLGLSDPASGGPAGVVRINSRAPWVPASPPFAARETDATSPVDRISAAFARSVAAAQPPPVLGPTASPAAPSRPAAVAAPASSGQAARPAPSGSAPAAPGEAPPRQRLSLRVEVPGLKGEAAMARELEDWELKALEAAVRREAARILGLPESVVRLTGGSGLLATVLG